MNNELISIIIPCFNSEKTIEKCLISVCNQDYENIEILIINDGSTDGTLLISENFRQLDSRIKIISQENSGVSKARNVGIQNISGKLFTFVDSDDWVEKNYCSNLYEVLEKNNADIAICNEIIEKPGEENKIFQEEEKFEIFEKRKAIELLLEDQHIKSYPWAKLFRKNLFESINFPENLEAFEDFYTMFKIFDKAKKVVKTDAKLYHYIEYSNSLSHNLTPQRAYHFFLAVKEANQFLIQQNIDESFRNRILKNQLKRTFMSLKRILRNTLPLEMRKEKEEIRIEFKKFKKYKISEIGLEYYLYIRFYINYPATYTRFVNI